jgi:ABC-type taurine transport system ATPase subunit
VQLDVEYGEFVSLVGAMGSGKSTLLSLLAGLTSPDTGTVVLDGKAVTGVRSDAAFVFQNYSLLPWFSALENVRLGVQAAFPGASADEQKAQGHRGARTRGARQRPSTASRASSRAACGSASRWPGRSPPSRACCFSTSRSARSTR